MTAPNRFYSRNESWVAGLPAPRSLDIPGFTSRDILVPDFTVYERRAVTKSTGSRNVSSGQKGSSNGQKVSSVSTPMGGPIGGVTPVASAGDSVSAVRTVLAQASHRTWVAFDTEFTGGEGQPARWSGQRSIVSWQFAFRSDGEMVEWLIVPHTTKALSLKQIAKILSDELGAPRYLYRDSGKSKGYGHDVPSFPVTLISHAAIADITTFIGSKALLQSTAEAGGGLFSMLPHPVEVQADSSGNYFYRASLQIRDTMCFSEGSSLDAIGASLGLPKLDMSEADYRNMGHVLACDPERYAAYAMRDCEIVYKYMELFCGVSDINIPPTAPAIAAKYIRGHITRKCLEGDSAAFDEEFRGVVKVDAGLEPVDDGQTFVMGQRYEYASAYSRELNAFAADAYRGGLNGSFAIGWYPGVSYDHDIVGAYVLGMSAGFDPDFSRPFLKSFLDEDIKLSDLGDLAMAPFLPGFGYVRFEFPPNVYLPSIGIKTDHGIVFPRTSNGTSGVPATLAEVVLALKLGATVHAERFDVARIKPGNGMLLDAYTSLTADRERAEATYGKGSPQERAAKLLNNSGYGKVAQAIDPKSRRDLWTLSMEEMDRSSISSPVHAAMGTGIVRCIIVAAVNELKAAGYTVHSATTDGFITNAPLDVVEALPLFGMRDRLAEVRSILTHGRHTNLFVTKHVNEGLLNHTTRGNVAANSEGVLARNGLKGYRDGTREERAELIERIVTRTAPLSYAASQWVSPADMLRYDEDFHVTVVERTSNPNFDFKRKPDLSTLHDEEFMVGVGRLFTPTFETRPFEDLGGFRAYKDSSKNRQIVNEADYRALDRRAKAGGREWHSDKDLVRFAVTAHRAGHVCIPSLSRLQGSRRIAWINGFLPEGASFSANDWKNAGRATRKATLPPPEVYMDTVVRMGGAAEEVRVA